MTLLWLIVYLVVEIFGNATLHLDPMNGWGIALIVALACDATAGNR